MLGAKLHRLIFSRLTRGESAVVLRCSLTSSVCHCCHSAKEQLLRSQLKHEPYNMSLWVVMVFTLVFTCAYTEILLLAFCGVICIKSFDCLKVLPAFLINRTRTSGRQLYWPQFILLNLNLFILWRPLVHKHKQVPFRLVNKQDDFTCHLMHHHFWPKQRAILTRGQKH